MTMATEDDFEIDDDDEWISEELDKDFAEIDKRVKSSGKTFEEVSREYYEEKLEKTRSELLQIRYGLSDEELLAYTNAREAYEEKFGESFYHGSHWVTPQIKTKLMLEAIEKGKPYDWWEEYRKEYRATYGKDPTIVPNF